MKQGKDTPIKKPTAGFFIFHRLLPVSLVYALAGSLSLLVGNVLLFIVLALPFMMLFFYLMDELMGVLVRGWEDRRSVNFEFVQEERHAERSADWPLDSLYDHVPWLQSTLVRTGLFTLFAFTFMLPFTVLSLEQGNLSKFYWCLSFPLLVLFFLLAFGVFVAFFFGTLLFVLKIVESRSLRDTLAEFWVLPPRYYRDYVIEPISLLNIKHFFGRKKIFFSDIKLFSIELKVSTKKEKVSLSLSRIVLIASDDRHYVIDIYMFAKLFQDLNIPDFERRLDVFYYLKENLSSQRKKKLRTKYIILAEVYENQTGEVLFPERREPLADHGNLAQEHLKIIKELNALFGLTLSDFC